MANAKRTPSKTPAAIIILITLLLFVSIGTTVVLIFFDTIAANLFIRNRIGNIPTHFSIPSPRPTPSYLPPGKQTYSINQKGDPLLPKIEAVSFDPLSVMQGETQRIEAIIASPSPVTSVDISLFADDHKKQSSHMVFSSADQQRSVWRATWIVSHDVSYRYIVVITATNKNGSQTSYVALRTDGPVSKADLQ